MENPYLAHPPARGPQLGAEEMEDGAHYGGGWHGDRRGLSDDLIRLSAPLINPWQMGKIGRRAEKPLVHPLNGQTEIPGASNESRRRPLFLCRILPAKLTLCKTSGGLLPTTDFGLRSI